MLLIVCVCCCFLTTTTQIAKAAKQKHCKSQLVMNELMSFFLLLVVVAQHSCGVNCGVDSVSIDTYTCRQQARRIVNRNAQPPPATAAAADDHNRHAGAREKANRECPLPAFLRVNENFFSPSTGRIVEASVHHLWQKVNAQMMIRYGYGDLDALVREAPHELRNDMFDMIYYTLKFYRRCLLDNLVVVVQS